MLLRIILLIGSASLLAFFAYQINYEHMHPDWRMYGLMIFLSLNFVYLLLGNRPSSGRIFRLISIWFDAKESELRQRADRSRQDK
jgi:hypothetical protein